MATRRYNLLVGFAAAVVVTTLWGCADGRFVKEDDTLPPPALRGGPRSVAADVPYVPRDGSDPPVPWYAGRRDAVRTVAAGHQSTTIDYSISYTHDHQYQSAGRVHDHFSLRTRGVRSTSIRD